MSWELTEKLLLSGAFLAAVGFGSRLWMSRLTERTLKCIDAGLANREPPGHNFFESDVRSCLGVWSFLLFRVMERLEKRGFVERVPGRPDEVTWIRLDSSRQGKPRQPYRLTGVGV